MSSLVVFQLGHTHFWKYKDFSDRQSLENNFPDCQFPHILSPKMYLGENGTHNLPLLLSPQLSCIKDNQPPTGPESCFHSDGPGVVTPRKCCLRGQSSWVRVPGNKAEAERFCRNSHWFYARNTHGNYVSSLCFSICLSIHPSLH